MLMAFVGLVSLPVVLCSAEVRFDVCEFLLPEPGCEDVPMSIGIARLPIPRCPDGSLKSGKEESSNSASSSVESTYELAAPANPMFF